MLVTSFVSMEINTQLLLTLKEGSKKKQNKTKRKINVKQTKRQRKKALAQFSVCESAKRWRYPLGKGFGLGLVSHFLRPLS